MELVSGNQEIGEGLKLAMLAELYQELRSYRDKEFQAFLFAFPIIGAGFISGLQSWEVVLVLAIFTVVVLLYVWMNHDRMMQIKRTIHGLQSDLQINELEAIKENLNPDAWISKPWYSHLGTVIYSTLLIAELLVLVAVRLG